MYRVLSNRGKLIIQYSIVYPVFADTAVHIFIAVTRTGPIDLILIK